MITIIKYILLGIIQGLTEPLPISSSGHLVLFKALFNTNMFNDLNFEIFLNFASFIAIFIIYFKDIKKLLIDLFTYITKKDKRNITKSNVNYIICIIISTLPVTIIGLLFKNIIELWSNKMSIIGVSFLFTSISLLIVSSIKGYKKDKDLSYKDAIIIGLIESIALLPGVSRSGMVLVACLLLNYDRKTSLKYTFMLYFPVSIGSFIISLFDVINTGIDSTLLFSYIAGMINAFLVTIISYKLLSKIVSKGKLWYFSIYTFILALFILFYFK